MKNILAILLLSVSYCMAADSDMARKAKAINRPPPPAKPEYYHAGDFSIDLFGGVATTDFDNERTDAGFGVNYFFTKNIGVGLSTAFQDLNGAAFDNVSLRGIYRIPIDKNALYGYVGGKRLLDEGDWSGELGVGAERRIYKNIGIFIEAGGEKELTGERDVKAVGRTGLRISF